MFALALCLPTFLSVCWDPLPELTLPPRPLGLHRAVPREHCVRTWRGERFGASWTLDLRCVPLRVGRAEEPELVIELLRTTRRAPSWGCSRFPWEAYEDALSDAEEQRAEGAPDDAPKRPRASLGSVRSIMTGVPTPQRIAFAEGPTLEYDRAGEPRSVGRRYVAAGLREQRGWVLELDARPAPSIEMWEFLCAELLRELELPAAPRPTQWSDEELIARWMERLPKTDRQALRIQRTEHFSVIGTASFGPALLDYIEAHHARVQAVLGFQVTADRRSLPIFLFRQPDEFRRAFKADGRSLLGISEGDVAATWYRSPSDPVLAHEIVHQLQRNRAFQVGGTLWISEGLAEALAHPDVDLRMWARSCARSETLATWKSMASSWSFEASSETKGASPSGYQQAGVAIDFVRQRSASPLHFQRFLEAACSRSRASGDFVEATLIEHLGCDWNGLQRLWRDQFEVPRHSIRR